MCATGAALANALLFYGCVNIFAEGPAHMDWKPNWLVALLREHGVERLRPGLRLLYLAVLVEKHHLLEAVGPYLSFRLDKGGHFRDELVEGAALLDVVERDALHLDERVDFGQLLLRLVALQHVVLPQGFHDGLGIQPDEKGGDEGAAFYGEVGEVRLERVVEQLAPGRVPPVALAVALVYPAVRKDLGRLALLRRRECQDPAVRKHHLPRLLHVVVGRGGNDNVGRGFGGQNLRSRLYGDRDVWHPGRGGLGRGVWHSGGLRPRLAGRPNT